MHVQLLIALLSLAPAKADAEAESTKSAAPAENPSADATTLEAAITQLQEAIEQSNVEPEQAAGPLAEAIAALAAFTPELAGDEAALGERAFAQLSLARAYKIAKQTELAEQAMDEAIRSAMGAELPVARLGPSLVKLHKQRKAALEAAGTGTLEVDCRTPCKVYVDEHLIVGPVPPLFLGDYRVMVTADDGGRPPLRETVTLTAADEVMSLEFLPPPPKPKPKPKVEPPPSRIMPRWGEVALISAGVAATLAGGVVMGIDGTCTVTCGRTVNDTLVAGAVVVGLASAAWISGTVMLTVDEVRQGRYRGRQATLSWTMRF